MKCLKCKNEFQRKAGNQKYCGSNKDRVGCSFANKHHWPSKSFAYDSRQYLRKKLLKAANNQCQNCGMASERKYFFDVDHKDGNRTNNKVANLWVLCPNCHRIKTYEPDKVNLVLS